MWGMPDHTQEKLSHQTVASMDILLHAKNKLSTSNSFWDTDWSRAFSVQTQELDFSQPSGFYRFSKVVYHLKPKNYIDGPFFFQNLHCQFISVRLGHTWLNPKKTTWSNCNFHENLTTFKKQTLYLKQFLWY